MGRPHSSKSGRPMGQKDTGVETTYGKAQRETATCQMNRRPHPGNQLGRPMFSSGQQWAEMMMMMAKCISTISDRNTWSIFALCLIYKEVSNLWAIPPYNLQLQLKNNSVILYQGVIQMLPIFQKFGEIPLNVPIPDYFIRCTSVCPSGLQW